MDYNVVESFIWGLENYFQLTVLLDAHQQARYASIYFSKSAQLWISNQNFDFELMVWSDLKGEIHHHF